MDLRRRLLLGTGLLVVVQLGHLLDVLRYGQDVRLLEVLVDPLAWVGIGVALAAFVLVALGHADARRLSLLAGAAVATGFLLYHGVPVDLGVNNPYWGTPQADADAIMWASVIALIAIGTWTALTAWRAAPTSDDRSHRERPTATT